MFPVAHDNNGNGVAGYNKYRASAIGGVKVVATLKKIISVIVISIKKTCNRRILIPEFCT
jgi:hypothetical protein